MADRTHDHVDPGDEELLAISAALDGEGEPFPSASARGSEFAARSEQIRRRVRVTAAEPVPDLTDAVLAELERDTATARPRRGRAIASVAAAFVLGAAVSAAFLLDRDLGSSDVAAAEISRELVRAQSSINEFDATISIVEHGVHPDVPERTYTGTLTYRSPERLAITIRDETVYPSADWVSNDVELVVDDDVAWRSRSLGCPVDVLPACPGPTGVDAIVGRAPFSVGWAAPLDLIVPAGDLIEGDLEADLLDDQVRITTSVREARSLVDSVLRNGAFRQVHPTDTATIELDADTLGLLGFTISASDTSARRLWATTWGYDDAVGDVLLDLVLTPVGEGTDLPSTPPVTPSLDAGFRVGPVDGSLTPERLPDGLELHRSGTQLIPTDRVDEIAAWSDGRAWVAVRSSPGSGLIPRPIAERLIVANGVAYLDRANGEVELFTEGRRYRLTGSLPVDTLVDIAGTLPVSALELDVPLPDDVPEGVLVPAVVQSIDVQGGAVTIVTTADDGSIVTIDQRPGDRLSPPLKTDSFEVPVRGTAGRYSSTLGTLTWIEGGWVIELSSAEADADSLARVATELHSSP